MNVRPDELFREHRPRLIALARSQGLTPEDARDAVQEAFFTFLEHPSAPKLLTSPREARAFVSVLALNAARNMRRRHHRARVHVAADPSIALPDTSPGAEQIVAAREYCAHLYGCLEHLDELPRRVVSLRLIGELSGKDVAKILNLTSGNVAVTLHRAKKELSCCMTRVAY